MDLPLSPPFAIRGRLLTPLDDGGTRHEPDGLLVVDDAGRIAFAGPAGERPDEAADGHRPAAVDPAARAWSTSTPTCRSSPTPASGAGLDLLTWLERYIFPLERDFDAAAAERLAPAAWRAFAAAGTTTALVYGAVYEASLDATFRAAEAHGIRAIIGKVMMDRGTYDPTSTRTVILDQSLAESARLIDDGTAPTTAASATPSRRGSPSRARPTSCASPRRWPPPPARTGRRTCRRTAARSPRSARLFPEALDYVDVYDRAGGPGRADGPRPRRPPVRPRAWPPRRDRDAGRPLPGLEPVPGVGDDAAGAVPGRGPVASAWARTSPAARTSRSSRSCGPASTCRTPVAWPASRRAACSTPLDWLRLGSLGGAQALGLGDVIGSLEAGKEADVIAVDPAFTAPVPGIEDDDPADIASRLIFRSHPDMVRAAWVRGRRLEGPGARG